MQQFIYSADMRDSILAVVAADGQAQINYEIEQRSELIAWLDASGLEVSEDKTINLVDGRLTNCFLIARSADQAVDGETADLLAEADERILELEYENLILKEGLA